MMATSSRSDYIRHFPYAFVQKVYYDLCKKMLETVCFPEDFSIFAGKFSKNDYYVEISYVPPVGYPPDYIGSYLDFIYNCIYRVSPKDFRL